MNRNLCITAFLVGAIAVGWIAVGYVGAHALALTMTLLIGTVYVFGALELLRFHQATRTLAQAVAAIPEHLNSLGDWLCTLHPSLQNVVRLRVEGERIGLPGPALTPYLVGLLVMLGMLGTFLGMVVTLNGAVMALETTTDLQTIRAALAAPVKGLGLAFGTSVAGVAASAMLGLISALCRRERLQAAQQLDTRIAGELRAFSLTHQRQETFKALQQQSQVLPAVADRLQAMMAQMEQHSEQLNARLLSSQDRFHSEIKTVYSALAASVDRSLTASLSESARLAGATLQPAVEAAMAGIAAETAALHAKVADTVGTQLDGIASRFDSTVSAVADTWATALATHERSNETMNTGLQQSLNGFTQTFAQNAATLLAGVGEAHAVLQADLAARDEQRQAALTQSVTAMATTLQQEWQQAGAQTLAQQQEICRTLARTANDVTGNAQAHAARTIDEIARLMQTAAEAPRVAAEVIGQLRQQLSESMAKDNALLDERGRLMASLNTLLDGVGQSAQEQRTAIEAMVGASAAMLERVGAQFTAQVGAESAKLTEVAAQVTGSAVEVASLVDAFGFAVQRFGESNDALIASLTRIEGALDQSLLRSDDQLAYTVAQARELIDLSILSQQRIVDELQQRLGQPAAATGVA